VSQRPEDFDFPNGGDREAILFLLCVDALEGNDFVSLFVLTNENAPKRPTLRRANDYFIRLVSEWLNIPSVLRTD